jgi:hypothetical protein
LKWHHFYFIFLSCNAEVSLLVPSVRMAACPTRGCVFRMTRVSFAATTVPLRRHQCSFAATTVPLRRHQCSFAAMNVPLRGQLAPMLPRLSFARVFLCVVRALLCVALCMALRGPLYSFEWPWYSFACHYFSFVCPLSSSFFEMVIACFFIYLFLFILFYT